MSPLTMEETDAPTRAPGVLLSTSAPMAAVRNALAWVLPAAAKTDNLPLLRTVRVEVSAPWEALPDFGDDWRPIASGDSDTVAVLTFAATDRYRLHWATIPLPDEPEANTRGTAVLSAPELVTAVRGWGKPAKNDPDGVVSLYSTDPESVTVAWTLTGQLVVPSGSAVVPSIAGDYPNLRTLIGDPAALAPTGRVMFNGKFLADLGKAATAVSYGTLDFRPTAAEGSRALGPCFVRIPTPEPGGPTFGAMLMPVRRYAT